MSEVTKVSVIICPDCGNKQEVEPVYEIQVCPACGTSFHLAGNYVYSWRTVPSILRFPAAQA